MVTLNARRVVGFALLLSAVLVTGSQAQRELTPKEKDLLKRSSLTTVQARPGTGDLGTGAIQYDPGAPADVILNPAFLIMIGNTFNSRNGQPLSPGTVTEVSWYIGLFGTLVVPQPFKVLAPGESFGSAPNLLPVATYAFNVAAIPGNDQTAGSSFFAGFGVGYSGEFGNIGLRSATTNSQGFHGIQRDFGGATTPLPGQNAMLRITGNVVIPVELLEFDVD